MWSNFEISGPINNFWTKSAVCLKFGTDHKTTPKWSWPGSRDLISKVWDNLNNIWTHSAIRFKFGIDGTLLRMGDKTTPKLAKPKITINYSVLCFSAPKVRCCFLYTTIVRKSIAIILWSSSGVFRSWMRWFSHLSHNQMASRRPNDCRLHRRVDYCWRPGCLAIDRHQLWVLGSLALHRQQQRPTCRIHLSPLRHQNHRHLYPEKSVP